jgi:LPS sulfotransferase NodH
MVDIFTPEQMSLAADIASPATVVMMNRKDRLAQAISYVKAVLTGRWHSYECKRTARSDIPLLMIQDTLKCSRRKNCGWRVFLPMPESRHCRL